MVAALDLQGHEREVSFAGGLCLVVLGWSMCCSRRRAKLALPDGFDPEQAAKARRAQRMEQGEGLNALVTPRKMDVGAKKESRVAAAVQVSVEVATGSGQRIRHKRLTVEEHDDDDDDDDDDDNHADDEGAQDAVDEGAENNDDDEGAENNDDDEGAENNDDDEGGEDGGDTVVLSKENEAEEENHGRGDLLGLSEQFVALNLAALRANASRLPA